MRPGERVTIIKRIASTLSQEPWTDLDLVLREFGFPTSEDWSGGTYDHAVAT